MLRPLVTSSILVLSLGCGSSQTPKKDNKAVKIDAGVVIEDVPDPTPLPQKEEIQVVADDGAVLNGFLFASADRQVRLNADDGAVVLLHGFGFTVENVGEFIADLQLNYTVVSIDLRLHGDSNFMDDGSPIEKSKDGWGELVGDVRAAVDYARDLNPPPAAISVVGMGFGATAALIHAADDPELFAVAALSPREGKQLQIGDAASGLRGRNLAIFASNRDRRAAKIAKRLKVRPKRYPKRGSTGLLGGTFWKDILAFLNKAPTKVEVAPVNADE
jgi:pimeloyl-ACP methyl ester carboxylesterase